MPFDSLPITSPTIERLRLGRALIIERGWARRQIEDKDGKLCVVGGITRQSHDNAWPLVADDTIDMALDYLAKAIPADLLAMAAWNDDPYRTLDDVIAAYDRAINKAVDDKIGLVLTGHTNHVWS